MDTDKLEDFMQDIKEGILLLKAGTCPIWQCGGELEYLEDRVNWQEPDMKCKNCGAIWKLIKSPGGLKVSEIKAQGEE